MTKKPLLFWLYRRFPDVPYSIKVARGPVAKPGYEVKGPYHTLSKALAIAHEAR